MMDRDLIQRVTANFVFWQGLRWVPFWVPIIVIAVLAWGPSWLPLANDALPSMVWGAAPLAYWWSTGRGRAHWPVIAVVFAAATPLPLWLSIPKAMALLLGLLGAAYVVGGILDHLALRRLLPPPGSMPSEVSDGRSV